MQTNFAQGNAINYCSMNMASFASIKNFILAFPDCVCVCVCVLNSLLSQL